ncbi:MAG: thioredoxin family protein [Clostridiales bacterium]|nr:thioredoxin family protein [Clostridiales bacterium]
MTKVFDKNNFTGEVLESKGPVIVKFWAPGCHPCTMMNPVMEEAEQKYAGRALIGQINIAENMAVARKFNVMAVPTLILFKDGKALKENVGYIDFDEMDETFGELI